MWHRTEGGHSQQPATHKELSPAKTHTSELKKEDSQPSLQMRPKPRPKPDHHLLQDLWPVDTAKLHPIPDPQETMVYVYYFKRLNLVIIY